MISKMLLFGTIVGATTSLPSAARAQYYQFMYYGTQAAQLGMNLGRSPGWVGAGYGVVRQYMRPVQPFYPAPQYRMHATTPYMIRRY